MTPSVFSLQDSSDIAIGIVTEYDHHDGNVVLYHSDEILWVEHESVVVGDSDHRLARASDFGTEGGGVAPAEGTPATTGEIGSGLVDRKCRPNPCLLFSRSFRLHGYYVELP